MRSVVFRASLAILFVGCGWLALASDKDAEPSRARRGSRASSGGDSEGSVYRRRPRRVSGEVTPPPASRAARPAKKVYDSNVEPAAYPAEDADQGDETAEDMATGGSDEEFDEGEGVEPAENHSNSDAGEGEHPLMPCVRWAKASLEELKNVEDYSCTMVKHERIDGELQDEEWMYVKVRHEPFSVYTLFRKPKGKKGQEAIYVDGANDNKLLAHGTGLKEIFGTVSLDPASKMAMEGNRYPITELGIRRLLERLIEVGEADSQYGECEVKTIKEGVKVRDRKCICIQVTHPKRRSNFIFHKAKIYIDEELNLPIRYEAYDWPESRGGEPVLMEEYTYLDLKLNNGFADTDFDTKNSGYKFRK